MTGTGVLRDYQVADLSFLIANKRSLLLHDPGGGKTPPVCVYAWYLWNSERCRSVWVMPTQLFKKNKQELLRFTHFTDADIVFVDGPNAKANLNSDAKIFIMSATRLRMWWEKILAAHSDIQCLMGDETHKYWKTDGSQRTNAFYRFAERVTYLVGMTGSLIAGRLDSAYPMIHAIEPRYYGSHQVFKNHHAIRDVYGNVIAWTNPERVVDILAKHSIKRSFESIYGPESKVIITELAEMSPKQREAYDEFSARAILELENSFLTGSTGGVFALRCRQIMAHPETFGLIKGETTGKDDLLDLHLENHANNGKPFIVFAAFKAEQERIAKMARAKGITTAILNGDVSQRKRADIDEAFRAGKIQVIDGSPEIATVGFNWDHCDHVCFTTLDYQDDTFYQAYRRCIRGVRATPLLITILEYADSIDQKIMGIIRRKSALANRVDPTREVYDLSVGAV